MKVIFEVVTDVALEVPSTARLFILWVLVLDPAVSSKSGVTAVSKTNPVGASRMIVPVPTLPSELSVNEGPVKVVYVPPVVSAEIVVPPVAAVRVPSAKASDAIKPEVSPLASSSRFFPSRLGVQSHVVVKSPWPLATAVQVEGAGGGAGGRDDHVQIDRLVGPEAAAGDDGRLAGEVLEVVRGHGGQSSRRCSRASIWRPRSCGPPRPVDKTPRRLGFLVERDFAELRQRLKKFIAHSNKLHGLQCWMCRDRGLAATRLPACAKAEAHRRIPPNT